MQLLTLSEARQALWRYGNFSSSYAAATVAELQEWIDRCNRVVETFFARMKPAHTYRRIVVPIYDSHITLPRYVQSLLGGRPITAEGCACSPLYIYSRFHEFAVPVSSARCCSPAFIPTTELAQTFRDPVAGFKLRLKSTATAGTYQNFGGRNTDWGEYFDAETLNITNGTVTGTREYNALPRMLKSTTTVGVDVYSVDTATGDETLIAVHAPGETSPAYQRYHVPDCGVACSILTRLCYVKLTVGTDIVIPSLMGAIQLGLQALQYEDESNWDGAEELWGRALTRLNGQKSQIEGEAELPSFSSVPGFGAGDIPNLL